MATLDLGGNNLQGDLGQSLAVPCSATPCRALLELSLDANPQLSARDLAALELPSLFPSLATLRLGPALGVVVGDGAHLLDGLFELPTLAQLELADISCRFVDASRASLDESLCNATALQTLVLRNVGLRGALPPTDCFARLSQLTRLDLSRNALSLAAAPPRNDSLFCASAALRVVDLSHNALNGSLCAAFVAPLLQFYSLRNNSLVGAVPWSLQAAAQLVSFDVADNALSGAGASATPLCVGRQHTDRCVAVPLTLLTTLPATLTRIDLTDNDVRCARFVFVDRSNLRVGAV